VATGTTTARSANARAADVVNIADYGAKCDGSTDDSVAINNAISVLRTSTSGAKLVGPSGKTCRFNSALNFTGIKTFGTTVDGSGVTFLCGVVAHACIDAFNTRYIKWLNVTLTTVATTNSNTPTIGIQIGNTGAGVADCNTFSKVLISGNYSTASFYNVSSETTFFDHVLFWNGYTASFGYSLIEDGYNHWNVGSQFLTNTNPVDAPNSFNETTFITGDFRANGPTSTIWLGFTSRHTFQGSYIGSSTPYGITLYWDALNGGGGSDGGNKFLKLDIHQEAYPYATDFIYVTGSSGVTSVNIYDLIIRDHSSQATNSVFKTDPALSGVSTITNLDMEYGGWQFGLTAGVFNSSTLWKVSGVYKLPPSATQWNLATANFSGVGTVGTGQIIYAPPQLPASTVATLPTCNSSSAGLTYYVTDANAPTYNSTLTGSSTTKTLALCNGSAWVAH
jgi:hypothetical protein